MLSDTLIVAILTGLVSGAATWGAVRIEMKYMRRDIDSAHAAIRYLLNRQRDPAGAATFVDTAGGGLFRQNRPKGV